jgi:hypothetical protein
VPKLVPAIGLYVLLRALDGTEHKMRIELPRSYMYATKSKNIALIEERGTGLGLSSPAHFHARPIDPSP